ncbi:hypothetical protein SAMN05421824_1101 [Hyunsoonleella jejuensis]|uniref:Peptidase E n=1 Tax=Hyunsoonleella jejuensis TaxID=419940 RepID=A0A1H9D2S9_9FLAO|nr:DUF6702 family protein [Hyunsoonleella jejuensis]SEQ07790.1 hypothetical protein SAMN05421824_1101 [Hyunsoonleella jejuensis]
MKSLKIIIPVVFTLLLSSFTTLHKYYVSNTQIEYVKDKKSLQIITRVFIDDFENVLKERYDDMLSFDDKNSKMIDVYTEKYLNEKLKISINGQAKSLIYIGKEIEMGIVKCYLEIEEVQSVNTITITNQLLYDLFTEQQNIIKLNINSKKKSYVLTKQNDNAMLNFN